MGSNSVILDFMFLFFNNLFAKIYNIHVLKDENYLVMKASEVIPVFLKDATWIASLGLIEGLRISMSCLLPHPIPFPSYFSLSSFVSDEKSLDHKIFFFKYLYLCGVFYLTFQGTWMAKNWRLRGSVVEILNWFPRGLHLYPCHCNGLELLWWFGRSEMIRKQYSLTYL